jgi:hypothetical protein
LRDSQIKSNKGRIGAGITLIGLGFFTEQATFKNVSFNNNINVSVREIRKKADNSVIVILTLSTSAY